MDLQPRALVWVDPDDEPEEGDFPTHAVVKATECAPIKTVAPASIWDLGARHAAASVIAEFTLGRRRAAADRPEQHPPRHARIVRDGDVTRYIPMRVQETPEWEEKERARRARQVLPKPPKQSFRLGKKEAA